MCIHTGGHLRRLELGLELRVAALEVLLLPAHLAAEGRDELTACLNPLFIYIHTHMHMYIYIYIYVFMYIYMYTYTNIYMYIYES